MRRTIDDAGQCNRYTIHDNSVNERKGKPEMHGRVGSISCAVMVSVMAIPASAVVLNATSSQPVFIGNVVAGKTYRVTAQGTVNLYVGWNNGQGLPFTADGKPTYAFPAPYTAFWPNGAAYDPSQGSTAYGIGGPQKLYGALLGSFSASPQSYGDYFQIGNNYVFAATQSTALYVIVNDCCFWDNGGSYEVNLIETTITTNYTYDALGRLVTASHVGGPAAGVTTSYAYDKASNRTRVTVAGAP